MGWLPHEKQFRLQKKTVCFRHLRFGLVSPGFSCSISTLEGWIHLLVFVIYDLDWFLHESHFSLPLKKTRYIRLVSPFAMRTGFPVNLISFFSYRRLAEFVCFFHGLRRRWLCDLLFAFLHIKLLMRKEPTIKGNNLLFSSGRSICRRDKEKKCQNRPSEKESVPLKHFRPVDQDRYFCVQCRSRWDGSSWAVLSGSTLFGILFWIYNCHRFGYNGCVQMQRWKSLRNSWLKGLNDIIKINHYPN